jgi:hypothetical protein
MENNKPITRLFFAKMKEAFINLPDEEKMAFMAKDRANLDELGMKAISMVDCTDTNDEWDYIGVEGWPSMEAVAEREKFENDELQISRYVEYKTYIGHAQSFGDYGKQQD